MYLTIRQSILAESIISPLLHWVLRRYKICGYIIFKISLLYFTYVHTTKTVYYVKCEIILVHNNHPMLTHKII